MAVIGGTNNILLIEQDILEVEFLIDLVISSCRAENIKK